MLPQIFRPSTGTAYHYHLAMHGYVFLTHIWHMWPLLGIKRHICWRFIKHRPRRKMVFFYQNFFWPTVRKNVWCQLHIFDTKAASKINKKMLNWKWFRQWKEIRKCLLMSLYKLASLLIGYPCADLNPESLFFRFFIFFKSQIDLLTSSILIQYFLDFNTCQKKQKNYSF